VRRGVRERLSKKKNRKKKNIETIKKTEYIRGGLKKEIYTLKNYNPNEHDLKG